MNELKSKDLEINRLINKIYKKLSDLDYEFNPLVRYDFNYGDFFLFINLIFYNREISLFKVSYNEEEESFEIKRFDKKLSIFPIDVVNNFEKDFIKFING